MSQNIRQYFNSLVESVLFWGIAMCFFTTFRYYGVYEEEGVTFLLKYDIPLKHWYKYSIHAGMVLGAFYAIVETFFERHLIKRLSIGLILILKTTIYFLFTIIVFTFISNYIAKTYGLEINSSRGWWYSNKTFWVMILYLNVCSIVFSFIKISNEKFGRGIFFKMLLGKYRKPKEEKRIFMFLDLKASTTIAEQLGHYQYSQLIQDCFYDLNEIVINFQAEIYQYVGDEAVLSWPYKKGLVDNNCVELFFSFQRKLLSKKAYYTTKYNVTPEFKAGLHGGKLMVAEVGVVKKELAYHGDVINTSARIQAECNPHKVPILISGSLLKDLALKQRFISKYLGGILLKGKKETIDIHTIRYTD